MGCNELPEFTLIPYQSVQSIGGNGGPHSSWAESLQVMKEISNLDFDIALLSCGHYGLPLVAHIKENLINLLFTLVAVYKYCLV